MPVRPVASSRRASGGMPSDVHHDRADHAAVRDADDRVRAAGVRPHDVASRLQAPRGHLEVRLALLPAGAAGEPACVAVGIPRLDLLRREAEPLADVDLAPACVERRLEPGDPGDLRAVSRARGRSEE